MASAKNAGGVVRPPTRIQPNKVFMSAHGRDTLDSVSVPSLNRAGFNRIEIPEGQVLTWAYDVQRWVPVVTASALANVVTANVITVAEPRRFTVGDLVYIAGVGYRTVTQRSDTGITISGAAISINSGAALLVDGGLSPGVVASIAGSDVVLSGETTGFRVGQRIFIGDGATIKAFTPVAANTALYAIAARILATGQVINVPITSDGSATPQEIVEALKAAGDGIAAFAALVTLTEDNAALYAAFDPALVDVYAVTPNLATSNASRNGVITAIDNGTKTITVAGVTPTGVSAADVVNGAETERHYKLTYETVALVDLGGGYALPNPLVPTQQHGEVRERLVNGLTAEAKLYLERGGIWFNNTAF